MTEQVKQQICMKFCVQFEHSSTETLGTIQKATAMGNWWLAASSWQCACPLMHYVSCIVFWWNTVSPRWLCPTRAQIWHPETSKLKPPLKGKRFQTVDEILENMMGKLMATGRTVWGPEVPMFLVSSSINVSIFPITWLEPFWTDLYKWSLWSLTCNVFPLSRAENKGFPYWILVREEDLKYLYAYYIEVGEIYINYGNLYHVFNLQGCI